MLPMHANRMKMRCSYIVRCVSRVISEHSISHFLLSLLRRLGWVKRQLHCPVTNVDDFGAASVVAKIEAPIAPKWFALIAKAEGILQSGIDKISSFVAEACRTYPTPVLVTFSIC